MTVAVLALLGIWGKNDWRDGSSNVFCKIVSDGADVTFCGGRVFDSLCELSDDRKSSIADGWKTGASDDRRLMTKRSAVFV